MCVIVCVYTDIYIYIFGVLLVACAYNHRFTIVVHGLPLCFQQLDHLQFVVQGPYRADDVMKPETAVSTGTTLASIVWTWY